jgi:hypothetical protein
MLLARGGHTRICDSDQEVDSGTSPFRLRPTSLILFLLLGNLGAYRGWSETSDPEFPF